MGGESSLSPLRDKGYTPKVNVESSKNLLDSNISKNIESKAEVILSEAKYLRDLKADSIESKHIKLADVSIDSKNIESKYLKLVDVSPTAQHDGNFVAQHDKNIESNILSPTHHPINENTESKNDVKEYKLDSIVTSASGYEQDIKNAPASISTIQQKELFKKPIRDMGNAVSGVPGVFTQPDKTGANKISMRGLDPSLRSY
ncbi:TonB-dependent receptor plug domain-containing protein [Helicobacter saguini]|uniref:TonB-dependent receptor plug domain-containing protein n=1 Tax=Helicobacter saguini TaxID=1548018 RepID=A0A4V6I1P6_9HELI|nr:TonB-dependent receptor plug domain-containing protein [Helicobacter saguini]MWV68123.1 TonB-dependent receptor plug domain-containing protein [Helicobacter saguini]TLD92972.1 hypothetical protein LS64_009225 [Helicobacter saguini]